MSNAAGAVKLTVKHGELARRGGWSNEQRQCPGLVLRAVPAGLTESQPLGQAPEHVRAQAGDDRVRGMV